MMDELLEAQYPVLTWWGLLTVLTRAAATVAMVLVFAAGALLAERGELTVGEVVAFAAFATLLIGKLDRLSAFVSGVFRQTPRLASYFELLDARSEVQDRPDAADLAAPAGAVRYEAVSYRFPGSDQGVFDLDFAAAPGETVALVGPTGAGKTTALALLQRLRQPDAGRILIDGQRHRRGDARLAARRDRRGLPGRRPLQPLDRREHPRRPPRRHRRRGRARRPPRRGARLHPGEARRLRLRHRRARQRALGRRAPAHRHRPRASSRTRRS